MTRGRVKWLNKALKKIKIRDTSTPAAPQQGRNRLFGRLGDRRMFCYARRSVFELRLECILGDARYKIISTLLDTK